MPYRRFAQVLRSKVLSLQWCCAYCVACAEVGSTFQCVWRRKVRTAAMKLQDFGLPQPWHDRFIEEVWGCWQSWGNPKFFVTGLTSYEQAVSGTSQFPTCAFGTSKKPGLPPKLLWKKDVMSNGTMNQLIFSNIYNYDILMSWGFFWLINIYLVRLGNF